MNKYLITLKSVTEEHSYINIQEADSILYALAKSLDKETPLIKEMRDGFHISVEKIAEMKYEPTTS